MKKDALVKMALSIPLKERARDLSLKRKDISGARYESLTQLLQANNTEYPSPLQKLKLERLKKLKQHALDRWVKYDKMQGNFGKSIYNDKVNISKDKLKNTGNILK